MLAVALAPAGARAGGTDRPTWTPCAGIANPRLECSTVTVPLDYTKPRGRTLQIAISRLPATDPALRRGVLFTTGGGPGGPGVPRPHELSTALDPGILARYDLVGFDIRFVERSTPITCGQPEEEAGGWWVRTAGVKPFPEDIAEARAYAQACARHAGWALPHATTANAARDMDRIRAALGERTISYLGASYAGFLGVTYSTLFPHRIDRLVLDSPVNTDTVWRRFELERTPEMETAFNAFSDFVAAGNATYGFGATRQAVQASFLALLTSGAIVGEQEWTGDELGYYMVLGVFVDVLWPVMALNLASIRAGSPPPIPIPVRPAALPGTAGVPADNHTAMNMAFRCGDNAWPRDPRRYQHDLRVYTPLYPFFGESNANITPCAFWPTARDNRIPLAANRSHGALVTAALRDASVPLRHSQAVRDAIRGSRLVTVDRQYHAPFPYAGNACLNGAVTSYLVTGQLPTADVVC